MPAKYAPMPPKYAPLARYLAAQPGERVHLSLAEIEAIIGASLPAGARQRKWWQPRQRYPGVQSRMHAAGWRVVLDNFWGRHPTVTFVWDGVAAVPPGRA